MIDSNDGIHAMIQPEQMSSGARRLRAAFAITPSAPLYRKEFGYYCLEEWYQQGLDRDADLAELFYYDKPGSFRTGGLGATAAAFFPKFEEKVLEDRGDYELVQDYAGRGVLCFKGRRNGFMPEYVTHPVKDMKSWEEMCKWRMNPESPERWIGFDDRMAEAREAAGKGMMIQQVSVGGFMFLRSLIGPAELLYMFYDNPELVHDCMQQWLLLADAVTTRHQEHVTLDHILLDEDVCYNHGPLVSPEMLKEFIFPYYQQLIANIKSRQLDPQRHLFVELGSDGNLPPVIDCYREAIGVNVISPCEVASGCDVVQIGKKYPNLVLSGGIDKRELAKGKDAIDRMLERIIPVMHKRGGYIPTCDHGVPAEVSLENYTYYRRRCVELGG